MGGKLDKFRPISYFSFLELSMGGVSQVMSSSLGLSGIFHLYVPSTPLTRSCKKEKKISLSIENGPKFELHSWDNFDQNYARSLWEISFKYVSSASGAVSTALSLIFHNLVFMSAMHYGPGSMQNWKYENFYLTPHLKEKCHFHFLNH